MGKYLDKFRSTVNKRQAQQVFTLLNKQRNLGQIRSIEDFTQRLDTLIRELTGTVIKPSLKPYVAKQGDMISSEQFNTMLDRVQDDLETSFAEAKNIDEVQISHETLVREVMLKNLRSGVAELESKISLYEFIDQDTHGFSNSIFSTFRESKEGRTQRNLWENNSLFIDPRTGDSFTSNQDATIELVGERLTLATTDKIFHAIRSVSQIFDGTCPQTDMIVTPPGLTIENIIDGQKGTYWVQSWLFTEKQNMVKAKIKLDFDITQEINFIEIEPVTQNGLYLESIHYINNSGEAILLDSPDLLITGQTGVKIQKVVTCSLILTFRNDNCKPVNFEYGVQNTLLNQSIEAKSDPLKPISQSDISTDLLSTIQSEQIQSLLRLTAESKSIYNGFEFTIGFDNIRAGLSQYESDSVYVSVPLAVNSSAILGLKTIESRPYQDPDDNSIKYTDICYDPDSLISGGDELYYLGSIEYWVTKQDLNSNGTLLRTSIFPILPLDVSRVIHERLFLTAKSDDSLTTNDIGDLIFYATYHRETDGTAITGEPDSNIIVYRNGSVLSNIDSDLNANSGWRSTQTDSSVDMIPNIGKAMRFRIQIIGGLPGDIYTVSYNPTLSSTQVIPKSPLAGYQSVEYNAGLQIVDLVGDLSVRRNSGQVVSTETIGGSQVATTSKFYCTIIMRQNTADTFLSPAVEEYNLLFGEYDPKKFLGD